MKKIALLCDYGMDDAIATVYLLQYAEKFEKIDILPVSGNFPLSVTYGCCEKLLSNIEDLPKNIRIVDTSVIEQPTESIPHIHGNDGMGDVLHSKNLEGISVIAYRDWLDEIDGDYTIISLGPCTVTADILKHKGELPLILMAGNISQPPNYNGYEFNHAINKEAFSFVVKYAHVAATLDTCHCEKCNLNKYDISSDGLLGILLNRYKKMSEERNEEVCSVYDLVAVVYFLHPERFSVEVLSDKDGNNVSVLKYISDLFVTE